MLSDNFKRFFEAIDNILYVLKVYILYYVTVGGHLVVYNKGELYLDGERMEESSRNQKLLDFVCESLIKIGKVSEESLGLMQVAGAAGSEDYNKGGYG